MGNLIFDAYMIFRNQSPCLDVQGHPRRETEEAPITCAHFFLFFEILCRDPIFNAYIIDSSVGRAQEF